MTFADIPALGWPYNGIANRLARHPDEVRTLVKYRQAIDEIPLLGITVLPVLPQHVPMAGDVVGAHGLLFNDALVLALMQERALTNLASRDGDFDRVPGITRYSPT